MLWLIVLALVVALLALVVALLVLAFVLRWGHVHRFDAAIVAWADAEPPLGPLRWVWSGDELDAEAALRLKTRHVYSGMVVEPGQIVRLKDGGI